MYAPSSQKLFKAALKVKDIEKFLSSLTHDELFFLKGSVKIKAQCNRDKENQSKAEKLLLSILIWQKEHRPIENYLWDNQPKPQFFHHPEQKSGLSEMKLKTESIAKQAENLMKECKKHTGSLSEFLQKQSVRMLHQLNLQARKQLKSIPKQAIKDSKAMQVIRVCERISNDFRKNIEAKNEQKSQISAASSSLMKAKKSSEEVKKSSSHSIPCAKIREIDNKNFIKSVVTFIVLIVSSVVIFWISIPGIQVELTNSQVFLHNITEQFINGTIIRKQSKINDNFIKNFGILGLWGEVEIFCCILLILVMLLVGIFCFFGVLHPPNIPKINFFNFRFQRTTLTESRLKNQKAISMQEESKNIQFQDKKYLQNFFQPLSEEKKRHLHNITCEWNYSQLSTKQKKGKDTQDCSLKEKMNEREDNSGFQMLEFEQAPLLHHCSQEQSEQLK